MAEKECPFCIIDPVKTKILDNQPLYFVAFSNPRLVPGHLLVVPRRHIEKPWLMRPEEDRAIDSTVKRLQWEITEIWKLAEGCDVRQNYRPFVLQSRVKVDHVHWHILPRNKDDEYQKVSGRHDNSLWKDLTQGEIKRFMVLFGK